MAAELEAFLARLDADPDLCFAPVRHHSPACARWLEKLIRDWKPDCLLVEAPAEMDRLLPWMADRRCEPPIAAYCYLDGQDGLRSYYPFAAFSPEWCAIRAVQKQGGAVRCIDLPFSRRVLLDREERFRRSPEPQGHDERRWNLAFDRIADRLHDASGSADGDHWWDRHFEDGVAKSATAFFRDLAAYGWLIRQGSPREDAENRAREAWMGAAIAKARAEGLRCLVVCGAFHVEGLLDPPSFAWPEEPAPANVALIPYSLARLDRYGYAAGLPLPAYYQSRWSHRQVGEGRFQAHGALAAQLIEALQENGQQAGSADAIELVAMAERLGALRGGRAGRQEWLEAAVSTLDKMGEGPAFLARCLKLLDSPQRGRLPADMPVPPLVENFRAGLRRWQWSERGEREKALDLYRSPQHREQSRFLHQLRWLEIPFAACRSGPDFAQGQNLHLVREVWRLGGNDEVLPALIEASRWGQSLAEASLHKLVDAIERRRPAEPAVDLVTALQLGLHPLASELCRHLEDWLRATFDPLALCRALVTVGALMRGRRLLDGESLPELQHLPPLAFVQTCQHLALLGNAEDEQELAPALTAIGELVGLVRQGQPWADSSTLCAALTALYHADTAPLLQGAALGGLAAVEGWTTERCGAELCRQLQRHRDEPPALAGFLRGFLALSRTALRLCGEWLDGLGEILRGWDEEVFLNALPGLRYAFSQYSRQELRELSAVIFGEEGGADALAGIDLDSVTHAAEMRRRLDSALSRWGWSGESA